MLSLFAVPIGVLIRGWTGAIIGGTLALLIAVVLDGLSVREIRILPGGVVEFRALLRRTRAQGSQITRVTGYLDEDEGTRSYNLAIAGKRREVQMEDFPEFSAFMRDLQALNPGLQLTGDWPPGTR